MDGLKIDKLAYIKTLYMFLTLDAQTFLAADLVMNRVVYLVMSAATVTKTQLSQRSLSKHC